MTSEMNPLTVTSCTRRALLGGLTAAALLPVRALGSGAGSVDFRVRTITAGVSLASPDDVAKLDAALAFLRRARDAFTDAGYEVQTIRVATQPLPGYLPAWQDGAAVSRLRVLDDWAGEAGTPLSIGPVVSPGEQAQELAAWAVELIRSTTNLNFTAEVAKPGADPHPGLCRAAAETIVAIAAATQGGEGNFRFAATAHCPPGIPFFPAAYHSGQPAFAIGLESPRLLTAAFTGAQGIDNARILLKERMNAQLTPVQALARELARLTDWRYLGIDVSPAPGLDASIGEAVEALSGVPFGEPATLAVCAAITDTLKSLEVKTCGYSGLMLPLLEDKVLARRATEGRYSVSELLLYSSVCGTGLDVVPLPGATSVEDLAATIRDVAALASRYRKPLSARLFPVPGKHVGDVVRFDNPHLTDATVMSLG